MQIVINIPENDYELALRNDYSTIYKGVHIADAIKNGTPLPKHHGRLIDADAVMWELSVVSSRPVKSQMYMIKQAPTIIEADKAEE